MSAPLSFLREIDTTIAQSSRPQCAEMVRHLTDLFLVNADQYSDDEIALIDDVFVRMVATIEDSARALLAIRLGPYSKAPPKILSVLAYDDIIDIASPVLTHGEQIDDATLIKCAKTKSQEHLLAISRRKTLAAAVTDVLVERGDQQVVWSTAQNAGAKFSSGGFGTLVNRSKGDDMLAACVGARPDISPQLFEKLLETASNVVRSKLLAESPHARHDIDRAVDDVTERIRTEVADQSLQDAAAPAPDEPQDVWALVESRKLWQSQVKELDAHAKANHFEATVAALAQLSNLPADFIERKFKDDHVEVLLILAKSIGLSWQSTKLILAFGAGQNPRALGDMRRYEISFARLDQSTAEKIVDFHRKRERPAAKLH
jgi:uncharacterized protein (DUF2336 family)